MKNFVKINTYAVNMKEFETKNGYGYNFSIVFDDLVNGEKLVEWANVVHFSEKKREDLLHEKLPVSFTGKIKIKAAWKDYPQRLSFQAETIKAVTHDEVMYAPGHTVDPNYKDPIAEANPPAKNIPM